METREKGLVFEIEFYLESVPFNNCREKRERMASEEHTVAEITHWAVSGARVSLVVRQEDSACGTKEGKDAATSDFRFPRFLRENDLGSR